MSKVECNAANNSEVSAFILFLGSLLVKMLLTCPDVFA